MPSDSRLIYGKVRCVFQWGKKLKVIIKLLIRNYLREISLNLGQQFRTAVQEEISFKDLCLFYARFVLQSGYPWAILLSLLRTICIKAAKSASFNFFRFNVSKCQEHSNIDKIRI